MKSFIASISMCLAVGSAAAATDHSALKKELDVMMSVFETSLQQKDRKHPVHIRRISSTYLAEQGAVFNFSVSGAHKGFLIDVGNIMSMVPEAPLPPMVTSDGDFSFDFEQDWDHFAEDAAEQIRDALRDASEKLRDLRREERDVSWEQRELEREKRELQFRLRNDRDNKEEIEKELAQIEKNIAELESKRNEVNAFAEQLETEQKQKQEERKQASEKLFNQFLADFEGKLGDTLCRFGAGLRALPKGEKVTFVLENVRGNKQDRIYVFDQKEIIRCVTTDIDANALLSGAQIYAF
jgi:hypothetical protein